jgi:hypothetical protein
MHGKHMAVLVINPEGRNHFEVLGKEKGKVGPVLN